MKRVAAWLLVAVLAVAAGVRVWAAQETTTNPVPTEPPPQTSKQPQQSTQQQPPAPVERRASKPMADGDENLPGPVGRGAVPSTPVQTSRGGDVETIRVKTRLVNVALNVVDAHGTPVGGFDKKDFAVFEDGKPQTIAVFEKEATSPLEIVLAIDSSETVLTSDKLEKEAAKHFVRAILREQDQLDLIDFADTVREIVPFTNQPKRIEQGLGQLQQGDETALYNAIYLSSQRLGETPSTGNRRRVLVVISDGGNQLEHGVPYEEAIEQAQRADAIIYSIIVVPIMADAGRNTGGEHAMIQMSEDTGGKYYYVADPSDLEPAFRHVSDDLRTQYLLGYYAPQGTGDNTFRRIRVKLTDADAAGKYSLRYRVGYFPEK